MRHSCCSATFKKDLLCLICSYLGSIGLCPEPLSSLPLIFSTTPMISCNISITSSNTISNLYLFPKPQILYHLLPMYLYFVALHIQTDFYFPIVYLFPLKTRFSFIFPIIGSSSQTCLSSFKCFFLNHHHKFLYFLLTLSSSFHLSATVLVITFIIPYLVDCICS